MLNSAEPGDEELVRIVLEAPEEEPLEPVALDADVKAAAEEEHPPGIEASGVTSHVLTCRGTIARSQSTFRAPTTGWLYMRVGYFDRQGVRLWLSPWVNKGSMNALTTKTHVEAWNFAPRIVARAVVVSRFPTWTDSDGSMWANC
jgi:hypothetical protein